MILQEQSQDTWGGWMMMLLMVVVLIIFFYLPQRRQKKRIDHFRSQLKQGDKIVTIGGIHGKVMGVKETTVTIRVDEKTTLKMSKAAISHLSTDKEEKQAETLEKSQ